MSGLIQYAKFALANRQSATKIQWTLPSSVLNQFTSRAWFSSSSWSLEKKDYKNSIKGPGKGSFKKSWSSGKDSNAGSSFKSKKDSARKPSFNSGKDSSFKNSDPGSGKKSFKKSWGPGEDFYSNPSLHSSKDSYKKSSFNSGKESFKKSPSSLGKKSFGKSSVPGKQSIQKSSLPSVNEAIGRLLNGKSNSNLKKELYEKSVQVPENRTPDSKFKRSSDKQSPQKYDDQAGSLKPTSDSRHFPIPRASMGLFTKKTEYKPKKEKVKTKDDATLVKRNSKKDSLGPKEEDDFEFEFEEEHEGSDPQPYDDKGLRPDVIDVLKNKLGWTYPTSIQSAVYPLANANKSIVASSWTGQGKTGIYMVPIVNQLLKSLSIAETSSPKQEEDDRSDIRYVRPKAIILTPSSELARQVAEQFTNFGSHFNIKTSLIINDKTIDEQLCNLPSDTTILVSTPGRLNQHLVYVKAQAEKKYSEYPKSSEPKSKSKAILSLTRLRYFVVDECDKLLSLGFLPEVLNIWGLASHLHDQAKAKKIQVFVCSATIVQEVHGLIKKLVPHHRLVDLNENMSVPKTVTQIQYDVTSRRKLSLLLYLIGRKGNVSLKHKKTLIFVRTIQRCDRIVERLSSKKLKAAALHSEVSPAKRLKVLQDLKDGNLNYIVATDIAMRGIDLPLLDYVVNFDLPHVPADYVHRVGRVGRAGREGVAVTFVAKDTQLIRRPNASNTTLNEQDMMKDISALLALSATDKNASKLEKRKIPGPFLDVDSYYQIKSVVADSRYSDLINHAILDAPSKASKSKTKKATASPESPSKTYPELMRIFEENSAKKSGVVVSKRDTLARL